MKAYLKLSGRQSNASLSEIAQQYGLTSVEDGANSGRTRFEKDELVFQSNRKVFLKGAFNRHEAFVDFVEEWMENRFSDDLLEKTTFPKASCLLVKEMLQAEHLVLKTPLPRPKDFGKGPAKQVLIHTVGDLRHDEALMRIQRIKRLLSQHLKEAGIFSIKEQLCSNPLHSWGPIYNIKTSAVTYCFSMEMRYWMASLKNADTVYQVKRMSDSVAEKEEDAEVANALFLEFLDWTMEIPAYHWNEEKERIETSFIEKRFLVDGTHHNSKEALIASEEERLAQQSQETKMRLHEALTKVQECQDQEQELARKQALLQGLKEDSERHDV